MEAPKKKRGRPAKKKATPKKKPVKAGLGDSIKAFTESIGVKACNSCNARAKFLNKAFPYNQKKGEMTKQQFEDWKAFKEVERTAITDTEMNLIQDTYNAINHTAVIPCRNCGASGWHQLIKNIDKHYQQYL
jgi:hypothetical protein